MRKLVLGSLSILMMGILVSCAQKGGNSEYPGYSKVENGLYVQYHSDNDTGRAIQQGDIVSMSMMYKTEDDSVIMDSRQAGQPVQLKADTGKYEGDILGAFIGMNVGDSASMIVNADSFFIKTAGMPQSPDFIDSASMLYFNVKIQKVQSMQEMQAEQAQSQAKEQQAEIQELQEYLTANSITTEPTESGLIYISKKKGSGKAAEAGKKVKVHYEGMLLDGTYFDTSVEEVAKEQGLYDERRAPYKPFEFTLGQGQVIKGWDEGIAMMKVGGKARFIIPSNLAYGANPPPGSPIKPFSTLIFDVELIEVSDPQ
jgi:FKBP-type peptidyl-prolyl cis-trans isomerase